MFQNQNGKKGLFIGFLSGAIAGVTIALLYAPTSGRKLRRELNNKANDFKEDAEELLSTAKDKAIDMIHDSKTMANKLAADARSTSDTLLKDANRIINDTKVMVSDAIKAGKDTLNV